MLYGVARISTGKQSIERQVRNILEKYPSAKIIKETYTGTKLEGRKEFEKLLKIIQKDDTIVFDEVSRMSRNKEEGCSLYEKLFNDGVNLIFLKEPHINTEVYKKLSKINNVLYDNQYELIQSTRQRKEKEKQKVKVKKENEVNKAA